MTNDDTATITGKGTLRISGLQVELEITVPAGPVRPTQMLPIFQQLANTIVSVGVKEAEAAGAQISCTKGCGACCRQLVPIAESEAHQLHALVEALPESRRTTIRARFAEAKARLQASGLHDQLLFPGQLTIDARQQLGLTYFQQGIACPFLEEESCSIHPDRPLACREYLVTSPSAHCAEPSAETVQCVAIPGSVSQAVRTLAFTREMNWVPLILAVDWAAEHPDQTPARPGPEWLQAVFQQLTNA